MVRSWIQWSSVLLGCLVSTGCGDTGATGVRGTPQSQAPRSVGLRNEAFREASARYGVREDMLLAHAYLMGRFEAPAAQEHGEAEAARDGHVHMPRFGVMHLTAEQVAEGARATGLSEDQVREELRANVLAAAALLRASVDEAAGAGQAPGWEHYRIAGVKLAGLSDSRTAEGYGQELMALLGRGLDVTTPDGERLSFAAVEALAHEVDTVQQTATAPGEYPPMSWVSAHPNNYIIGRDGGTVKYVLIHVTEGGYWGTLDWFSQANPSQASTQYVIQSSTGNITQMVSEANAAWHAGNEHYSLNSIGIEHEGYVNNPSTWYTDAMYRSSASLVCAIAKKYGIPVDQQHIIGHYQVPNPYVLSASTAPGTNAQVQAAPSSWGGASNHYDPGFAGSAWNWSYYLGLIRDCVNAASLSSIIIDSNASNNDPARARIEVSANWTSASSTAGYYGTGYYYASTAPVSDGANFWFYLPTAATRTVDAWWTTGANRSTTANFIAFDAAGNKLGTAYANQQLNGGKWNTLGTYNFSAGWNKVVLSRWTTEGYTVIADAVRIR
ncbi:N-acetylmuramoyl-L-alanine amidase [Archangium sp.]|uniref:N-acetylmuramoyl-L-alanine amidase n=1 Tax=Archangium sp. TaxID=1872627 RepID=UPI002D24AF54|nr:N-acetylmuramoyl-L-alanine amidase [Archangium sp.]HYO51276.1 N-acetylmuramoyl-L-alanine amidase [Archangium sp.]